MTRLVLGLILSGLGLTLAYTALVAFYALSLDAWREHQLYAPAEWDMPPPSPTRRIM